MRELRVIGVTPDSAHIVCVDAESGQKFRLPADEKLRAAARGDLARFGQIEIEMEASMRPRDIQARIRAGASVEQVTEESGMPTARVDRFAYPVLLERSRAAELAQKAHPVRADGPAVEILIDVVTAAFSARGHTLENAEWDAWKDEKGYWVSQLQWQNGRSEIAAHWRYQPDAHGGTVSPLDDPATDLIDPDFGRALRGLESILPVEAETSTSEPDVDARPAREAGPARPVAQARTEEFYDQRAVAGGGSAALPPPPAAIASTGNTSGSGNAVAAAGPAPTAGTKAETSARTDTDSGGSANSTAQPDTAAPPAPTTPAAPAAPAADTEQEPQPTAEDEAAAAGKSTKPAARNKRGKASMPSWEDVLLGVRSSGN